MLILLFNLPPPPSVISDAFLRFLVAATLVVLIQIATVIRIVLTSLSHYRLVANLFPVRKKMHSLILLEGVYLRLSVWRTLHV